MGVRIWPPSMPFFAEPSTRLSRVVPQEDCLSTSTSVMPYLAKNPFSAATNSGAASVRAIKPSLALVVSTSPAAAQALLWWLKPRPPNRAMPPAAAMDCLRKRRREASSALVVSSGVGLSVMAGFPLGEKKRCHAGRLSRWAWTSLSGLGCGACAVTRLVRVLAKAVPGILQRSEPGAVIVRLRPAYQAVTQRVRARSRRLPEGDCKGSRCLLLERCTVAVRRWRAMPGFSACGLLVAAVRLRWPG